MNFDANQTPIKPLPNPAGDRMPATSPTRSGAPTPPTQPNPIVPDLTPPVTTLPKPLLPPATPTAAELPKTPPSSGRAPSAAPTSAPATSPKTSGDTRPKVS